MLSSVTNSLTMRAAVVAAMMTTVSAFALPATAGADSVLRIGMTAADIPRTLGQPDQGFEASRCTTR